MRIADDRGATLVFAALGLTMMCGFVGLAVDFGQVWSTRRALVTATDSAALAGAHQVSGGGIDGCAESGGYVSANAPGSTMTACTVVDNGDSTGTITITATEPVDYAFGPVLGFAGSVVDSTTTASWSMDLATGLRPFSLCEQANPEVQAWLADPTVTAIVEFSFTNADNVPACNGGGNAMGNWGFTDFDGGSNSNNDIRDWIEHGYNGTVITTSNTDYCSVDQTGCYEGSPGALSGSHAGALSTLVDSGEIFPMALFVTAEGGGAGLDMKLTKVISARLLDYKVNGSQSNRYLTFEFQPGFLQNGDPDLTVGICAVGPSGC